jgi:aspartate dehydrogenase
VIVSDPSATTNPQEIEIQGSFGRFQLKIENRPSATNPRTSAIVAMSLKHALERRHRAIVVG